MANLSSLRKKIKVLEDRVLTAHEPDRSALRWQDGSYDYNGKFFATEEEFDAEVEKAFRGRPPDPNGQPQVLVITFFRPRPPFHLKSETETDGNQA